MWVGSKWNKNFFFCKKRRNNSLEVLVGKALPTWPPELEDLGIMEKKTEEQDVGECACNCSQSVWIMSLTPLWAVGQLGRYRENYGEGKHG